MNNPVNAVDPDGLQVHEELSSVTSKRGFLEVVKMALEEMTAKGTSLIRHTETWTTPSTWVKHHVYPKEFKKQFDFVKIKIDLHTLRVPEWFHKWIHCGDKGGWWNREWRTFFHKNPKASKNDIEKFLRELLDRAGLGDVKHTDLIPYR